MLNFGASKPRVRGGPSPWGPPWIRTCVKNGTMTKLSHQIGSSLSDILFL